MAVESTSEAAHESRARMSLTRGFGRGPVIAGGLCAAALIPVLIFGGWNAVATMADSNSARVKAIIEAQPTSDPGATPDSEDPVSPPDRDSDQNPVPTPVDEIYVIQDGDTLTDLSIRFGMSVDYIADYNAVRDVNVISEGAVLRVPFIYIPPTPAPPAQAPVG